MDNRHVRRPRLRVADVREQYVWTGKKWARRGKILRRAVKWLAISAASVAGGLLLAVASMLASLALIWAVTALVSYLL